MGDTLTFTPDVSPPSIANQCIYQWSNGITGATLTASPKYPTTYYLTVTYQVCNDTSSLNVDVLPQPEINLPDYVWLDPGETEILDAGPNLVYYYWSNGYQGRYLTVIDTGKYWVTIQTWCENQIHLVYRPEHLYPKHSPRTTMAPMMSFMLSVRQK